MTWVNSPGHVLFPFAIWQHDHAQTPLLCETSMAIARRPQVKLAAAGVHPVGNMPASSFCYFQGAMSYGHYYFGLGL